MQMIYERVLYLYMYVVLAKLSCSFFTCNSFYRASICEGGLGSRNSVCLSVRPSVTCVDCDKTK